MKPLALLPAMLLSFALNAQNNLRVINATSKKVAIRDGDLLDKNAWSLSPSTRPDIFTADRSRKVKWVTFYTDIDSIRIKVKPGTRYDFVILLNGKDSCFTQIASAIAPETPATANTPRIDTIPFTLIANSAIHVKALVNNKDTLNLHFDVGSFDFHFLRDVKTHIGKVTTLQMGNHIWNNPDVMATGNTAREMDGRFGWNLFEGRQVEINYDQNLLIVYSRLPNNLKGYKRSKIDFIRSSVCVKGTIEIAGKKYTGSFSLDTGSEQAAILDGTWAGRQNFPKTLKLIKSSQIKDPRGVTYETRLVQVPLFKINKFKLIDIPTLVLGNNNPTGIPINYLGNDFLKRFNIILDFKNDYLYLKPNKLTTVKYRESS